MCVTLARGSFSLFMYSVTAMCGLLYALGPINHEICFSLCLSNGRED